MEFIEQQRLNIKVSDGIYKIIPYTKNIIETTFIPTGEIEKKASHAVVLKPKQIDITFEEKVDHFVLQTDGILVKVQKSPFQIKYYHNNKLIISEAQGYIKNDSLEGIASLFLD